MLNSFQKAAVWDKPEHVLSPEEKLYISDPQEYNKNSSIGFDIEKLGAMQHMSAWADVVQKAKSIRAQNGIQWFTKKPYNVNEPAGVVQVEGLVKVTAIDSTFGSNQEYLCQIYFPHPLSRSCFGWACQCRWHDFVWQRRRFYGRFCSHALALYQTTRMADVDYSEVDKRVYDAALPELIEDNRLSPGQLSAQIARARRRLAPSEFMKEEDRKKFYEDVADVLRQLEDEDSYEKDFFGENFEKLFDNWNEKTWFDEDENKFLSIYDNDRTRELRRKIKQEVSNYNSYYSDYDWVFEKIREFSEKRKALIDLGRELKKNLRRPDDQRLDVKEIWDSFGLSYEGNSLEEEAALITKNMNKLRQQQKVIERRLDSKDKTIEELKKELISALEENKYIANTKKITDDMLLDMIDQLHMIRHEQAYRFLKRFETGIQSGGDRQSFAESLMKAYAAALRQQLRKSPGFLPPQLPEGLGDEEQFPSAKDINLMTQKPEDFAPAEPRKTEERELISEEPFAQETILEDGTKEIKNLIRVKEVVWKLDRDGNRLPDPVTITRIVDPTEKRSSISVLSSDIHVKDIVLYIQKELAFKAIPKGYVRKDLWGELRGGLVPHPDAIPIDKNEFGGVLVYKKEDLGFDPETGAMGSQNEDRGLYGFIPVGSPIEIRSVDPKSRMVFVRFDLNSEHPNHTHIDLWIPLKEVDLI